MSLIWVKNIDLFILNFIGIRSMNQELELFAPTWDWEPITGTILDKAKEKKN